MYQEDWGDRFAKIRSDGIVKGLESRDLCSSEALGNVSPCLHVFGVQRRLMQCQVGYIPTLLNLLLTRQSNLEDSKQFLKS